MHQGAKGPGYLPGPFALVAKISYPTIMKNSRTPTGITDHCNYCKRDFDTSLLVKSNQRKNGYVRKCLGCARKLNAENKVKNADAMCAWYKRRRAPVLEYKDRPCADCGQSYPSYVMDLDHVRGTKRFVLSQAHAWPEEDVLEELKKCDVVCANCHRIRTFTRVQ